MRAIEIFGKDWLNEVATAGATGAGSIASLALPLTSVDYSSSIYGDQKPKKKKQKRNKKKDEVLIIRRSPVIQ